MRMRDMSKAINHTCRHQSPIKKVVSDIPTRKMSPRELRIKNKKWSSYDTRLTIIGKEERP